MINSTFKKAAVLTAVALITLGAFSTAYGITNGEADGQNHPYVGLVAIYTPGGDLIWYRSGVLISPKVFVTSAYALFPAMDPDTPTQVRIFLDPAPDSLEPEDGLAVSEVLQHPDYCVGCGPGPLYVSHNVGVVILDEPVTLEEYALLPQEGLVDTLPPMAPLDLVGYGAQYRVNGGGTPTWQGEAIRCCATSELVPSSHASSDEFMVVTTNPAQGKGGVANDSGAPAFLKGTRTILAVCSGGHNINFAGIWKFCRVDTQDVLNWLLEFL